MKKIEIKNGDKFGYLLILKEVDKVGRERRFLTVCDCGVRKIIQLGHLRSGHTKSCGCLSLKKKTKHSLSRTKFYYVFRGMLERCTNPKHKSFHRYGGRGINVKWKSFEDFSKDMFPSYKEGLTIDRINNKKDYSKKNCRWVTRKEQQNNLSSTIRYKGEVSSDADFRLGGKPGLVWSRINQLKWTKRKAFTTPIK